MTNDRETENARERLAVRLRETLGAAVREIRPSHQDGIALDVFAGSLPDVAAAAPKLKDAGFWPLPDSQGGRTLFLAGAHSADGRDALPYLIAVFPAGSAAPQEPAGLDAARAAAAAMRENGVKDGAFALLRRKALADYYLGRTVEIAVDRPIGYVHAKKTYTLTYPLNYGYLPGVIGGDGEELDVYLMGVETPVSSYTARIIGVVHRENDEEDKLVAAPEGMTFHQGEIAAAVEFQEKYYKTRVEPLYPKSCGALVYRETEAGRAYLCLLQRRSGTYSVPKGHMEAFETETQTARREVLEETGLDVALRPDFRAEVCYDLPGGKRKRLTLFLAACGGEPRPDEGECVSGVWLDARQARERLPAWYSEALERAERLLQNRRMTCQSD